VAVAPATRHLGLDLGGTNIKWVVLEHEAYEWRVLDRGRQPTPDGGPPAVLARMAAMGKDAMAAWSRISSVGIGVPGLYYPESGATRFLVNMEGDWDGAPVQPYVGRSLGVPAVLINDARAFGLAELRLGAGRGASSMVGFVLGTGVGAVIAVDGDVHQGHDGTAGELGHMTIDPAGPSCNCGNNGCLEAFVRADRLAEACGTNTAAEAEERARAGDTRAREGLDRVAR
jgi:glucokinase